LRLRLKRAGSAKEFEMKKLAAVLITAAAAAVVPVAIAPAAQADICAGAHGRHVGVGGCTNIAGDVATGVAIAAATDPYVPGEIPCYTVEGVPYYTPPGDPC
jgi:hypothetical protein